MIDQKPHEDLPQRRQHHRLHTADARKEQNIQRQKDRAADSAQPDPPRQREQRAPRQHDPFAGHDQEKRQEHQPNDKRNKRCAVRRARAPIKPRVRARLQRQAAARENTK